MKKLLIATAAALLALPSTAVAKPHTQHAKGPAGQRHDTSLGTTQQQTTTTTQVPASKNAAVACRAELKTGGAAAFAAKYGTNANGRNAFGKCVSQQRRKAAGASLSQSGTGSSTTAGSTTTATLTLTGKPVANATATVTLTLATPKTHGKSRKSCAPATGTATLTDATASSNALTESLEGRACNTKAGELVFTGRYTITSGTGTLAASTGTGRVELVVKTDGTTSLAETGRTSSS